MAIDAISIQGALLPEAVRDRAADEGLEHLRRAGRLGALARYRIYGNPGTSEGRQKAGLLFKKRVQDNPNLVKKWGMMVAKEIRYPAFSPLLAEFVGALIGDGGIRSSLQVTISFNSATETAYAQWLQLVISRLFGLNSAISFEKKSLGGTILISSVNLVRFLGKATGLKPGNKLRNGLDVPAWIWHKQSYQIACLRGLIDTDGSAFIHRYRVNGKEYRYPKLAFCSASDRLRESVFRLFLRLGFHPRLATRSRQVFIDRQEEFKRFYRIVGTRHIRRGAGVRLIGASC